MSDLPALRDEAIMPTTFEGMMQQADVLVKSGLLPAEVKSPAAAAAIMLTGRELGIPPMQAFRSVYVVKGKPTLSAQLMGALILRAGHSYKIVESSNERCEIEFRRRDGTTYRHEFTAADAKRANLSGQTWQAYPKAMLFSRCMSAGARVAMPDVLAGMYTPEELADPDTVVVDEAGEVIDVVARPAPHPNGPAPTTPTYTKNERGVPMMPTEETEQAAPTGWETWSDRAHAAFWAKANELGLSKNVVHAGFDVESMKEFTGTMDDAKVILLALDYAVNKTDIGVAGLNAAISDILGGRVTGVVMQEGATFADVKDAVDQWIEGEIAKGATIQRQEGLPL